MTYYNISNIENTINENSENFKLLNSIPKQWNYKGTFNGFQRKQATQHISGMPKNIRYSSMPILYQHREKFGKIWERFEPNSVITNRGCLNQLATMNIGSVKHCTFKLYKARDVTNGAILDQYILELGNSVDTENLGIYQQSFFTGACVAGMLIKDGKCSPEFNTYKLSNFKMNLKTRTSSCPAYLDSNIPYFVQPKNSIKVYYTSEIDAFIKDGYDNKVKHIPVEIKAKLDKNNNMDISPKTAFF
uniref:Uncharacterized protein n=1 Tax=Panagrolaimus sp. ES5 TaxID=591445 RepID=A0AC34FUT9_9BILA